MASTNSSLSRLRSELLDHAKTPTALASSALASCNGNASHNSYLELQPDWTSAEAEALPGRFPDEAARPLLYGIPVSLKDCFDLQGFHTSCGSRFYSEYNGIAEKNSWMAERLRSQGAVIIGKTHLQQLAYGITGENRDYNDCLQPRNAEWLTGGSSSGAAASLQEGSAMVAIGTDTGGSIRVPAALCGLAGFRTSLGAGDWHGGAHLAPSFDTIGCLFHDLRDATMLGQALFDIPAPDVRSKTLLRIGSVGTEFLYDCDPAILSAFERFRQALPAEVTPIEVEFWNHSFEIFAPIQAHEAAGIHRGHFDQFEISIADRLAWGASIGEEELGRLHVRRTEFHKNIDMLFREFDFLVAPCAPVTALLAGTDHSTARQKILRYTTPASVGGNPVAAVPFAGTGFQLIARHGEDAALLSFAATIGEQFAEAL